MKKAGDLATQIERLNKKTAQRAKNKHSKSGSTEPAASRAPVAQLPVWPDATRGVPNGFIRSALFSAVKRGRRKMVDDEVASIAGVSIRYTGLQLNQNDLTVWESILHESRGMALGEPVRVTAYQLLKIQEKRDNGQNRQLLLDRMERLVNGTVKIKTERYTYIGGLIHDAIRDDDTHEWVIWFNPRLQPLFLHDQYTQIDWRAHLELDGRPLAQWLHGFYATHKQPLPYKMKTIKRLCGSETRELWKFRQTLKTAMRDVEIVTGWKIRIDGDLLHIKK